MFGMIGQIGSSLINNITGGILADKANKQNQQNFDTQRNDVLNNNQAGTNMLQQYMSGGLDKVNLNQGHGVDTLNPFLSLHSIDMAKQQMELSKDMAYNGTQRKVQDLKKAGLSPLLATGQSSSYSPVSTGSTASSSQAYSGNGNTQQAYKPDFKVDINAAKEIAELKLMNAQANKTNAEAKTEAEKTGLVSEQTKLVIQQVQSELKKQGLTDAQTRKYEQEIETAVYNLDLSRMDAIRTTDSKPYIFNLAEDIVDSIGIDKGTALFDTLLTATVGILVGSKANMVLKGGKVVFEKVKDLGSDFLKNGRNFTKKGFDYLKNKFGKDKTPPADGNVGNFFG